MTAFTPNIPAPNNDPSDDQPLMTDNFTAIQQDLDTNHVAISDTTNRGKHKYLQMPEQASAPATAANEGALYTKEAQSTTNLFFRRESNGSEIQLTAAFAPSSATNGYTYLPGNIQLAWGSNTATGGTTTNISFSRNFSASAYSVVTTMHRNDSNVDTIYIVPSSISTNQFQVRNTSGTNRTFTWIAIGPA
jgi:hypothetical protein